MPRQKKQRLKQRKDGRFACRYKSLWFYGQTEADALAQREEYRRLEKQQAFAIPTVQEFADRWIVRAYPSVSASTMAGLRIHLRKLTDEVGSLPLPDVRPSHIKAV